MVSLVLTALLAVKAIVFAGVEQQVVATVAFKELELLVEQVEQGVRAAELV